MTLDLVTSAEQTRAAQKFLRDARLRCTKKREEMNRAYKVKQDARAESRQAWHYWQAVLHANSCDIDRYDIEAMDIDSEEVHFRTKAHEAHQRGRSNLARSLQARADKCHKDSKDVLRKRSRLAREINCARESHMAARQRYHKAKADYAAASQAFIAARKTYNDLMEVHRLAVNGSYDSVTAQGES